MNKKKIGKQTTEQVDGRVLMTCEGCGGEAKPERSPKVDHGTWGNNTVTSQQVVDRWAGGEVCVGRQLARK